MSEIATARGGASERFDGRRSAQGCPGRSDTRRREYDYGVGVPGLAAPVTRGAAARTSTTAGAASGAAPLRGGLAGFSSVGGSRIDVANVAGS
jgi:hypothetical protein